MKIQRVLLVAIASLTMDYALARAQESADSLKARTVDSVFAGDEAGEHDHNQQGEKSEMREVNGSKARFANASGWFAYDFKVHTNGTQILEVQCAGGDATPQRVEIWVGTNKLGSEQIKGGDAPGILYYLGARMIRPGKVTVKFQAPDNARTPSVASVKITMPVPTIASMSKASSTRTNYLYIVNAVNDLREPLSSGENVNVNPNAKMHFDWWPAHATNQWVQYDFAKPEKVSASEVYWFDDSANRGGCRPPKAWTLYYRANGEWKPVQNPSAFGVEKDKYNRVTFDAVETDGLKLEATMPEVNSSGVLQWKVE